MKNLSLQSILYNETGRTRSGWRFLIFLSLFTVFGVSFNVLADTLFAGKLPGYAQGNLTFMLINSVVSLAAAVLIGWLCGKYLEDLPFRALGCAFTQNWLKHLIFGLLLGAAAICLAVLIAVVFGGLSFQFNTADSSSAILRTFVISMIVLAIAAAFEEVLFRGYILQTFARARLAWVAIVLTSVFFATAHLGNASANWISTSNTALAGIWFAAAYLKTRDLWFPFGLHFIWNWLQGAFFGIEISGFKDLTTAPFLREIDSGPAWLTGGNYGIEGGIACFIALIFSIGLIYFLNFLKPSEDLLKLTDQENPVINKNK